MTDRDALTDTLTALAARPLDATFAARVGAVAKAELRAPARPLHTPPRANLKAGAARFRRAIGAGLVPALLSLVAVVETAATASTVAKLYGKTPAASSK